MSVAAAFDAAASTYDATFTDTRLGRWLRRQVWDVLGDVFQPGQRVLEIGCGTGEDAVWLARRGISVVATDVSGAMLARAREKARLAGVGERVSFLDQPHDGFDGALANFGVLNCVANRPSFAEDLAGQMRTGGRVVLVLMGPLCAWEMIWHVVHLQPGTALRRLSGSLEAQLHGGARQRVWYPSPLRLRRDMRPWFSHRATRGIGVLLPPSYLGSMVTRWPSWMEELDRVVGGMPAGGWVGDHYLSVFERQ